MARLVRVNGTVEELVPKNAKFQVKELQKLIGGYFEFIILGDGYVMVVDEDGTRKGLAINWKAAEIYGARIVGDVLIAKRGEL
jgi:hypothetical protein